jgi:hypothetical protein
MRGKWKTGKGRGSDEWENNEGRMKRTKEKRDWRRKER